MKALLIVCEWLLGLLVLLVSVITVAIGLIVSLFELPRYLRIKAM
jgi:hypothetical protein